jgi:hypothetical protein
MAKVSCRARGHDPVRMQKRAGLTATPAREGLASRPRGTPDLHCRLGACGLWQLRISVLSQVRPPMHVMLDMTRPLPSSVAARIPGTGISHRDAGSSPRSGTEEGDISPVFAVLEHAAGDFTTLGARASLGVQVPPDTRTPAVAEDRFTCTRLLHLPGPVGDVFCGRSGCRRTPGRNRQSPDSPSPLLSARSASSSSPRR